MHRSLEVLRVTWTAGAAERASVKQIMHMSSASCFRQPVFLSQPCRHGRQVSSFFTPPQGCPQGWVLLQASLEYSWGTQCEGDWWSFWLLLEFQCKPSWWCELPGSLGPSRHCLPPTARFHSSCRRIGRRLSCWRLVCLQTNKQQKRLLRKILTLQGPLSHTEHVVVCTAATLPVCSLNSTIAFIVLESARAMSQKSLVLPQPSWRSTFMASSSSLNTWKQPLCLDKTAANNTKLSCLSTTTRNDCN